MFKTFVNAFKIPELRKKILYVFFVLVIVRLGSQLAIPGIDGTRVREMLSQLSNNDLLDAFTGGSLSSFSIFALSITPYITSSIIMQLLTIAIPKLEELHQDEDGRKKINEITRYLTVGLAVIESAGMAIGFGNAGYFELKFMTVVYMVVSLTAGSTLLMWLGERITEKGVGNGISIILVINIVSRMPNDITGLYRQFISAETATVNKVFNAIIIIAIIVAVVAYVVILNAAERRIPIQYAKKIQGNKMVGGQATFIPLKVNTAGVIPIIFASSILQVPIIISQFFHVEAASGILADGSHATVWQMMLKMFSQSNWFKVTSFSQFKYTLGFVLYIVMLFFFAYFYTSITFNPIEVSNNMKKSGGFVPGIRPGKPTTEYLMNVLNSIILIGAIGLSIVATVPIFFSGVFKASVSFGGTSLIIIVGVIIETVKQIESQLLVRHYKGFLSE